MLAPLALTIWFRLAKMLLLWVVPVYLYPGEQRTVDEMLIAIAVGSGNDAAYAMAEYIGGTMPGFVELMNQRAKELGMENTHFVNPHGLHDDDHYTTAYDLGILAYHALSVPKFLDYTSIYEYEFRPEPKLLTSLEHQPPAEMV